MGGFFLSFVFQGAFLAFYGTKDLQWLVDAFGVEKLAIVLAPAFFIAHAFPANSSNDSAEFFLIISLGAVFWGLVAMAIGWGLDREKNKA